MEMRDEVGNAASLSSVFFFLTLNSWTLSQLPLLNILFPPSDFKCKLKRII